MAFRKAVKEFARLRLALCGIAGSGKTYSALRIASEIGALMRERGHGDGRIALIDSERGSASLYAKSSSNPDGFDFDVDEIDTFSPMTYVEKIHEAERAGYDIIIADSISHAWSGKDGALDQKDRAAERSGNSWTSWRDVTPKHNAFVDAMVGSRSHLIATMRQKMEHVQETNGGKTSIRKVGLAAVQREGMEYEFTVVGDLDLTNTLKITKTRLHGAVSLSDIFEKPGRDFACRVYDWLSDGARPSEEFVERSPEERVSHMTPTRQAIATIAAPLTDAMDAVFAKYLADMSTARTVAELDGIATGPAKPLKGTANHALAGTHYTACRSALQAVRS